MSNLSRTLQTRRGRLQFPTYIPVATFDQDHPLDMLLRHYLHHLAQAVMVSYHYARTITEPPGLPLLIDSGGFAALFHTARVVEAGRLGVIEINIGDKKETIHPSDVLSLQQRLAEVAFTLDFPIPVGTDKAEAHRRIDLTVANAYFALANRQRKDMPLLACIQAFDQASARACVREYKGAAFDGYALGGLVPRARDMATVLSIVEAVREEIGQESLLHVFGLGKPEIVAQLFEAGVDSVDSSAPIQEALAGRLWGDPSLIIEQPTITESLHLALCNLALAVQQALPLSTARVIFRTQALTSPRFTAHPASRF